MKILAFSGSLRADSFNTKLIKQAAACASRAGATVTLANFRDLAAPLYDGDVEESSGLPAQAQALVAAVQAHDALMISTPEYNASVPGPLKNAFDWASRPKPYCLSGKPILLLGASTGRGGAKRSMEVLRATLAFQEGVVLPEVFSLPGARQAFDAEGRFVDGAVAQSLDNLVGAFLISIKATGGVS